MDLVKIEQILRENGIEMKIEVNRHSMSAFFWLPDIFGGISFYGTDKIQKAISDIPAIKELIIKDAHEKSVREAIKLVEREGYRVEEEAV